MSSRAAAVEDPRPRPGGSFKRAALGTYGATVAVLLLSLATGVLIARTLGPSGRGELTAVITPPLLIASFGALGCSTAVAYHQAREPDAAPRLLATWSVILVPAAVIALVTGELLLPVLLSAQTAETIAVAQIYMFTVVLLMAAEPFIGMITGDQDFSFANVIRMTPPSLLAASYALLWATDALTVTSAVVANAVVAVAVLGMAAARVSRRHRFGRPDVAVGRKTLWYGLRAHGDVVASTANTRLDLMIMPAFLGATSVGHYSVAANVAGIVISVCGSLSFIAMSAAARRGPEGPRLIVASLQVTMILGGLLAGGIALVSGPAVRLIYGADFAGSVTPLRLLLPGVVLMAAASVVAAGLYAAGRPFRAFLAQLAGMVVTVPGLILFLPVGGPTAAAIVSSASYATVFVVMLTTYLRSSGVPLRDLFRVAPWMRDLGRPRAWGAR